MIMFTFMLSMSLIAPMMKSLQLNKRFAALTSASDCVDMALFTCDQTLGLHCLGAANKLREPKRPSPVANAQGITLRNDQSFVGYPYIRESDSDSLIKQGETKYWQQDEACQWLRFCRTGSTEDLKRPLADPVPSWTLNTKKVATAKKSTNLGKRETYFWDRRSEFFMKKKRLSDNEISEDGNS